MSNVKDLTIYRATGHIIDWGDDLGRALHEIDKANRAVEATLALFPDRRRVRSEQKWKAKLQDIYRPWWPDGAA